jgi:hypothetical protein
MGKLKISGKVKEMAARMVFRSKCRQNPRFQGNFKRSLCQKMVGHLLPFR